MQIILTYVHWHRRPDSGSWAEWTTTKCSPAAFGNFCAIASTDNKGIIISCFKRLFWASIFNEKPEGALYIIINLFHWGDSWPHLFSNTSGHTQTGYLRIADAVKSCHSHTCPTTFLNRLSIHTVDEGNSIAKWSQKGEGFSLKYLRWSSRKDFSGAGTLKCILVRKATSKKNHIPNPKFTVSQNFRVMLCSLFSNTPNKKPSADHIRSSITTVYCCILHKCGPLDHSNNHIDNAEKKESYSHTAVLVLQN